jgi:hypothetical protein
MKHELWKENNGQTFCLAGPLGDSGRSSLEPGAELVWIVEADSHFDAMTKYYRFMDWGEYSSDFPEDKEPYPESWLATQLNSKTERQ